MYENQYGQSEQTAQAEGGTSQKPYSQPWAGDRPGCLIILIDQSGSMSEAFPPGTPGGGTSKADAAAMVVNNVLSEMQLRSLSGSIVRPRVDVAVLGYGPGNTVRSALAGTLANRDIVSITDIANNPLRVEKAWSTEYNPATGALDQVPRDVQVWVEPVADNGTPMCQALQAAAAIAQNWVANGHTINFPPIILNVTDGEAGDGDPVPYAQEIASQIATTDGNALVFNCHLSTNTPYTCKYPSDMSQVPPDPLAQQLFNMSSTLPDAMVNQGVNMGVNLQLGSRGFVFGVGAEDMAKFLTIASLPKLDR